MTDFEGDYLELIQAIQPAGNLVPVLPLQEGTKRRPVLIRVDEDVNRNDFDAWW